MRTSVESTSASSTAAAAILNATDATSADWKRSTARPTKLFRRSTSCPSVALLAYLRTQRDAAAAESREEQVYGEAVQHAGVEADGEAAETPQEDLDWEREHKGEADLRARLSYQQPQTNSFRGSSFVLQPDDAQRARQVSSDTRIRLLRHQIENLSLDDDDDDNDHGFALGDDDLDLDREREDERDDEWELIAMERVRLEQERADLFDVVRMWRSREEEQLTKEAKARRALKLLLQVNDNFEDDMLRWSYGGDRSHGGHHHKRSRAIMDDMEAEERRGNRRLSLVVDVLTRMAREQLEGNLNKSHSGNARIDHRFHSSRSLRKPQQPFAYAGKAAPMSGKGQNRARTLRDGMSTAHVLDHSRFDQGHDRDHESEKLHKARQFAAKHAQQRESESKEAYDERAPIQTHHQQHNHHQRKQPHHRGVSKHQHYIEYLAAAASNGGDGGSRANSARRRAVSQRNFKRPSLFATIDATPRVRTGIDRRHERMERVVSVATFDRRGRREQVPAPTTEDDDEDGDEDVVEPVAKQEEAEQALKDVVAAATTTNATPPEQSAQRGSTAHHQPPKPMTASSEAVLRRRQMKRCLTDEIMNILRDSDETDGMDVVEAAAATTTANGRGSIPRVRASKSEEIKPVAAPQRRNVIWRDCSDDDVKTNVESASADGVQQAAVATKRHAKVEPRPSARETSEERRARKQLNKRRAKLQKREMKKSEKQAKKEERKRDRVWTREVKDLKRQLRLQKKKRNKDSKRKEQQDHQQEQEQEELDGKAAAADDIGAKKRLFGKFKWKRSRDDVANTDNGAGDDEKSPRQQRRKKLRSVSLRSLRKKEESDPDHITQVESTTTTEEQVESTTAGGGMRLRRITFWRKRSHHGSKKDAADGQSPSQPSSSSSSSSNGATSDESGSHSTAEVAAPVGSASARLPSLAQLANASSSSSHTPQSSCIMVTTSDVEAEAESDRDAYGEDPDIKVDENDRNGEYEDDDDDDDDELEEWERSKGKGKEKADADGRDDKRESEMVPVTTAGFKDKAEDEFRYSVAMRIMGQPLFGKSLAELIENQRVEEKILGIPTLAVPRVMYVLCRALLQRSSAGGNMEGLFRVSGSGVEVQRLREQIELRDYDVCAFDCYAIASCMEAWLSQLPEPIIPEAFYNDCVKNANRPDQSLMIIDRIPEINKCAVWCVCEFVRRITQPKQVIRTMMNAHSLAIVFAPSLLRCGDQAIMFYLSTFEVMFVQNLFQSYANLGVPLISLD